MVIYLLSLMSLNELKPLARVVELVDSLASGASARKGVRVRLPPRAPKQKATAKAVAFCFGFRQPWVVRLQRSCRSQILILTPLLKRKDIRKDVLSFCIDGISIFALAVSEAICRFPHL